VTTQRLKAAPPPSSSLRPPLSWAPSLIRRPRDARGLRGEWRGSWSGKISLGGWRQRLAQIGDFGGFWRMQVESVVFSTVTAGLNNQRGGKKLLFRSLGVTSENIPNLRGRLVDYLD
jgi:hypothetical protein